MRSAIWVLSGFAALWSIAAITGMHWPLWLIVVPIAITAALILAAARAGVSGRGKDARGRHIGRVLMVWSAVEVAAIVLVVAVLPHFGLRDATNPAIVLVVGLHFIPLALRLPFKPYYATGVGVAAFGVIGLLLMPPLNLVIPALGAAAVLWGTAVFVLIRETA